MTTLIACVNQDWAIGLNDRLLYHIPDDMKFFKNTTTNNIVVMGRNTLQTLPRPEYGLPNRINIIMSHNSDFKTTENYYVAHNIDELKTLVHTIQQSIDVDVYVIGGANIYSLLLDFCDKAFITKVYDTYPAANKFCPNLDKAPEWEKISESDIHNYEDKKIHKIFQYKFITYEKTNQKN